MTDTEEPEQTVRQPPILAPQQWRLYKLLAHARTLAKHSIQPYTDVTYVEHMLHGWPKDETEVLEGHTGPPDTTPCTTWAHLVPDRDIHALAKLIRDTVPKYSFTDNNRIQTTPTPPS